MSSETRLTCVDLCVEGENRVISVKVHQGHWDLSPAVHKAYRSDCKMAFHEMTQEALPSWGSAVPHRSQITAHHSAALWVRTGTVTAGFEFKGAVIYSQILWLVEDQWFVEMQLSTVSAGGHGLTGQCAVSEEEHRWRSNPKCRSASVHVSHSVRTSHANQKHV